MDVGVQDKLDTETKDTPLQEKLDDMANFIGYTHILTPHPIILPSVRGYYHPYPTPYDEPHL